MSDIIERIRAENEEENRRTDGFLRERPYCSYLDNWLDPDDGLIPEWCPLPAEKEKQG